MMDTEKRTKEGPSVYKRELEILKEDFNDLKLYLEELRGFLPVSLCTISSFWVIVDINKTTERFTGYAPLEIIGQVVEFLFKEKAEIEELKKEAGRGKEIVSKELTLLTKEKREIPVSVSIKSRKDSEGNLVGYFLTATDISRIKEYQRDLEKKTKELQERVDELERFHKLTVGRELKMIELKKEIKKLNEELEKRTA